MRRGQPFPGEMRDQGRLFHRATRAAARGPRLKGAHDEGKISFFLEIFFEKNLVFKQKKGKEGRQDRFSPGARGSIKTALSGIDRDDLLSVYIILRI